jgi:hypothetical protein
VQFGPAIVFIALWARLGNTISHRDAQNGHFLGIRISNDKRSGRAAAAGRWCTGLFSVEGHLICLHVHFPTPNTMLPCSWYQKAGEWEAGWREKCEFQRTRFNRMMRARYHAGGRVFFNPRNLHVDAKRPINRVCLCHCSFQMLNWDLKDELWTVPNGRRCAGTGNSSLTVKNSHRVFVLNFGYT